MTKLSSDDGANLRHLLGRTQPIKSGHQRRVEACWDRNSLGRNCCQQLFGGIFFTGLQRRLGHFLDE